MLVETQIKIRNNPYLYRYLRDNSSWYKALNRDPNSIKQMEIEMKNAYKLNLTDKIDNLSQKIDIDTLVDSQVNLNVGDSYSPSSKPFRVTENGVDVTSSATVTTTITDKSGSVVSSIDTSSANTYIITYTIKYDGETSKAQTTVKIIDNNPVIPDDD